MSWQYGLVEVEKQIGLYEIYYLKQGTGLCPVQNKELNKGSRELIISDITLQLQKGIKLTWKNNKLYVNGKPIDNKKI